MAVILWALGLSLLLQGCLCSPVQTDRGCMRWRQQEGNEANVCCEACHPGNHLVRQCGPKPEELCAPCGSGMFTAKSMEFRCTRCTQCVGAQVLVKKCTTTTDTQCGCKEGLTCGNVRCSFCVTKCDKGEEPTADRKCRKCPNGTFNDQIHQKCKPWSTKCPNSNQKIEAMGDEFNDIKCTDGVIVPVRPVIKPEEPAHTEHAWPVVLSAFTIVLMIIGFVIISTVTMILYQRKKKPTTQKKMIIRTPTDEPRTLMAIECSFHEAQQEQGSSSESLASKDSSEELLPRS